MRILGFDHAHVTEREVAHMSPCGWDDAKWEDCTFMSAIEWWRATGHPDVPATHEEGEHLRCASGRSMLGGTNLFDVRRAIKARYGADTPAPIQGFAALWSAITPGAVAVVQGSMGAFSTGSRYRRWASFGGAHAVCVFRPDGYDRVWWCDPLAPVTSRDEGAYFGEWMSKADLKRYVDGLAGYHLVGRVVASEVQTDMWKVKPGGALIGTGKMKGAGRSLLSLTDPKGTRYPNRPDGEAYSVIAAVNLTDDRGTPIDIDGNRPPRNGRDQLYIVDRPEFGAAAFALRADVTFTPATAASVVQGLTEQQCQDRVADAVAKTKAAAKVAVSFEGG